MARRPACAIAWLTLTTTLHVATVAAQAGPAPTRAEAPEAVLVLLREGVALRATGDDTGALARFEAALSVAPDLGRTRAQIGLVEHALGRWAAAEASLVAALASDDPWIGRHREELVASLAIVRSHLPATGSSAHPSTPDAIEPDTIEPDAIEPDAIEPAMPVSRRIEPPAPPGPPDVAPASRADGPHVLAWVGLAATLVGLAALLPTTLLALDAQSSRQAAFDLSCPPPQTSACAGERARLEAQLEPWAIGLNVIWGAVALGGALAAAGIALTLAAPDGTAVALGPDRVTVHW